MQGVQVKFNKICVLGLGYIGLPTASTFATNGLKVIGVDVNPRVVETLSHGGIHIHEPGLRTLVEAALKSGNLTVSARPEEADAFLIAVPTPFHEGQFAEYEGRKYKLADMGAVTSAAEAIVPYLRKGNLVILESTSPPRTTIDLVAPILERSGLKAGSDFFLCYSPERVLPGQILRELIENARVVGGVTPESAQSGRDLYATFVKGRIIETDATTAEMVKLMENTTRDVNIAIANEFSRLAEKFGVDIWEAIRLANLHPRINILSPGPGVGGHCISVDPWFFVEAAPELTPLIYHARLVNDGQPHFVVDKVQQALGSLGGKKIAALGLAYKPDVDDLRESPAVEVVHLLQGEGAQVKAWEPFKPDANLKGIDMTPSLDEALKNADAILILVKHYEFVHLEPNTIAAKTRARLAIDTVNAWDADKWEKAGFQIVRLGVNKS
ncbi:MAG: UDP-N-acetyl-D-mannosamine dehydrogenase [Anaerolineales bacterium]|nr:MAG: UDP-N-acetyl-D-mannosamine dehydrogenase [Anaerolineales bacterium]